MQKFNTQIEEINTKNIQELEKIKNELSKHSGIAEARLSYYGSLGVLCHKAKTLANECKSNPKNEKVNSLSRIANKIQETLYAGGIYLIPDHTFQCIHSYKNLLGAYVLSLNNTHTQSELEDTLKEILEAFVIVDKEIVKRCWE